MADKKYVLRILALALVFGFLVAGCNDGVTWKNVTEVSQVTGTWKVSFITEDVAGKDLDPDYRGLDVALKQVAESTITVSTDELKVVNKTTSTYSGDDLVMNWKFDDTAYVYRTLWDEIRVTAVSEFGGDYTETEFSDDSNPNDTLSIKVDNASHVITWTDTYITPSPTVSTFNGAFVSSDGKMLGFGGFVYIKQ
jgi:hypothetical protein